MTSTHLDHVLRVARYARNSDDSARRVRFQGPCLLSSDFAPAVECARLLASEGLPAGLDFLADDAFNVHFLAGYAIRCGRGECYQPLVDLAAIMWANIAAASQQSSKAA